jgi:N-acetylglucosamine malate deacetylase 1
MLKDFVKKIRWVFKYDCLNQMLNILSDKGRREFLSPIVVDKLPFGNVLILTPHPDDEVLGCGGSIVKHKKAGDKVSVVCLTDGSRGNLKSERDEALIKMRKDEMSKAHKILGINKTFYLDAEDGKLKADDKIVSKISDIFKETSPDAIYLPFFLDLHKDHVETSRIFLKSASKSVFLGKCIAYEVNTPIFPNTILDITDCVEKKIDALKCYKSQLSINDYLYTVIEGLNRFRTNSVMLGKGYAEGFFQCDVLFYKQLMESYFKENFTN